MSFKRALQELELLVMVRKYLLVLPLNYYVESTNCLELDLKNSNVYIKQDTNASRKALSIYCQTTPCCIAQCIPLGAGNPELCFQLCKLFWFFLFFSSNYLMEDG